MREDLRKIRLYTGTLVSYNGQSTVILIGAPGESGRTRLYRTIYETLEQRPRTGDTVRIIGALVAESLLGIHILEDLGVPRSLLGAGAGITSDWMEWEWPKSFYELGLLIARKIGLLPVAIGVMVLISYASFQRVTATLLPLMEVGACLVFVFGLMG